MKIALSNESFSPQFDGVAVCVENYAKIINKDYGTSYVIVPGDHNRDMESYPFTVIEFPTSKITIVEQYKIGLPFSSKFRKKLNETDMNLVHSHCPFVTGLISQRVAKNKGIPHISTFHSKYKDDVNQRLKLNMNLPGELVAKYVAAFYEKCDYVWTVSNGTAETLKEYGYKGETLVMPNGCDMEVAYRDDDVRKSIAEEYSLDDSNPILLFVGRLTYLKNIHLIVKALGVLKRRNKKFSMLFVGSGEDEKKLKALVEELELEDYVKFAGKVMDREKLKQIYASSDLFVLPSVYDNAPLVVREAAACGCASLLIGGSNSAEGVVDGVNGILTKEKVADIAMGINDALYVYDSKKLGETARESIYISWDDVLVKVTKEYERILADWESKPHKRPKKSFSSSLEQIDLFKDFNLKRIKRRKRRMAKIAK